MNWRDRCRDKLVSPQEAVHRIKSGDVVSVAPFTTTPYTLCNALIERGKAEELTDVRIDHPAGLAPWVQPGLERAFTLVNLYTTPFDRAACHAGQMEYVPTSVWRSHSGIAGFSDAPDVYLVPVSPPDAHGYCSFGPGVWFSGTMCRNAGLVIAEVHEDFIRTYGENYVHIDDLDLIVESDIPTGSGNPLFIPNEEETAAVEVICTLVASELINNRDTLQVGVGTVSSALGLYLQDKEDLGIQTELITGGIVDLVERGVVTGKYKTIHPYKVVASACVLLSPEEFAGIDMNPVFELYDFGYTDDLRRLIQIPNFVCVNNALTVDLTGQVCSESLGYRMYSGVGGQTVFMIAGAYSPGGKSVSVLPSSSVPSATGQRVSRIVPVLEPGGVVTVPRTFVDYVVTEQGIATLRGKSIKERARELVSVAHPDFRADLAKQAKEMFGA
jgi:4-hydroxybutyrate CoA-transferase